MADKFSKAIARARQQRMMIAENDRVPAIYDYVRTAAISKHPVPNEILKRHYLITADPDDERLAPYKALRTRVWRLLKENRWRSLAVTSARAGEGKTLTALNLGISLAMMEAEYTVIVIDLDLRRPRIHEYFEFLPEAGVADFITAGKPVEDILVDPGIERFVILPGNNPVSKSSELLSSPRLERMFKDLKGLYPSSIMIVDLPPMLSTDDALVVLPHIDASLLVVEDAKTEIDDLSKAAAMLQNTHFLGAVLNKAEPVPGSYY